MKVTKPGSVQRALFRTGKHDGHDHVPVAPRICSEGPVQECCVHLWLGHLHRRLPLHQDLQLLGRRLRIRPRQGCRWRHGVEGTNFDRRALQRRLSFHGLAADSAFALIEILLVMNLSEQQYSSKAWTLGLGSALMIVSGYYGELVVTGDLTPRWGCWFLSMCFFLYIVYE